MGNNGDMIGKEELEGRHVTPSAYGAVKKAAAIWGLGGALLGAGAGWGATSSQVARNTADIAVLKEKQESNHDVLVRLDERVAALLGGLQIPDPTPKSQ